MCVYFPHVVRQFLPRLKSGASLAAWVCELFKDVGQYFQYEKGFVHMDTGDIKVKKL